jgi:hypothetical protein
MIFLADYFGPWVDHKDATEEVKKNAEVLLEKVANLLDETYGGFRPQDCPQGSPNSSHKVGRGVDIYDPLNALDNWLTDALLEKYGLYRESPLATKGWCHLSDRAPGSGRRTFSP